MPSGRNPIPERRCIYPNKLFGPLHICFPFFPIGQRLIHLGFRQLDFLRASAG
jgi:hypothetical protein